MPKIGKAFKQNESVGTVESVKVAADLFTPVSCEITQVNYFLKKCS